LLNDLPIYRILGAKIIFINTPVLTILEVLIFPPLHQMVQFWKLGYRKVSLKCGTFEAYRKRAFSLIEVCLFLLLVAVLVGIVAGNAGAFIKGSNFEPPDRV
jgi:hypothetical protein